MTDAPPLAERAPAKVNLFLEIVGRRDDGYHDLLTVMQEVDLADRLEAEAAETGRTDLVCDAPDLPVDEGNLVVRAAQALREAAGIREGVRFRLEKRIPAGAGLGGGSSDAAAALRLLNRLWRLRLPREDLARVGAAVGSDVPFFLWGGTCLCEGRGERVTPLPGAKPPARLLLVLPPWGIATGAAYRSLAGRRLGAKSADRFLHALRSGSPDAVGRESYNRFEEIVGRLEPRQPLLHARLADHPSTHAVRLSGSGAAVWCLPAGDPATLAPSLAASLQETWPPLRVLAVRPAAGPQIA